MKKLLIALLTLLLVSPALAQTETLSSYFNGHKPSVKSLVPYALDCGIKNYRGTAQQNILLLACFKADDKMLGAKLPQVVPTKVKKGILGAGYNPVTGYQSRTTGYISASATTIPVVSTKDKAGNQIDLTSISASGTVKVYMNLEAGTTSKEEPIVCTGLTVTSWTGCTRGLSFQGSSEVSSSTIATPHNAGASIIITNIGQFYNQFVAVDGNQQVNGIITFAQSPLVPTPNSGQTTAAASVAYVNSISVTGGATSTEQNIGFVQLPTQAQVLAGTASSSAGGPLVLPVRLISASSSQNKIPVSQNTGSLDPSWIDQTASYTFSASNTLNATTTFGGSVQVNASSTFSTGTTTIKQLETNGRSINLFGVPYAVPTSQGAVSSVLLNDGSGNLSWTAGSNTVSSSPNTLTLGASGSPQTVWSATIPASTLGANGCVNFYSTISDFDTPNNGDASVFGISYGGTSMDSITITNATGGAISNYMGVIRGSVCGNGTTGKQFSMLDLKLEDSASYAATNVVIIRSSAGATATVDSTSAQTLTLSATTNNATALTFKGAVVMK